MVESSKPRLAAAAAAPILKLCPEKRAGSWLLAANAPLTLLIKRPLDSVAQSQNKNGGAGADLLIAKYANTAVTGQRSDSVLPRWMSTSC